nr:MAG TPA: hypothetical protein [Caudoviricetes sp.]
MFFIDLASFVITLLTYLFIYMLTFVSRNVNIKVIQYANKHYRRCCTWL